MGAVDVQSEVKIHNIDYRVDAVADFKGRIPVRRISQENLEVHDFLDTDTHAFENKAQRQLKKGVIGQIRKAKGSYKNIHALVLADTQVNQDVLKGVYRQGGDVLRAGITEDGLMKRLELLKRQFYLFRKRGIEVKCVAG